jgi:hypothetical protein
MRGPFRWLESALSQPCASRRTRHLPARGLTGRSWTQRQGPSAWLTRWHCGRSRALAAARLFDPDAYRRHRGEVVTQVLPETADRPGATSA